MKEYGYLHTPGLLLNFGEVSMIVLVSVLLFFIGFMGLFVVRRSIIIVLVSLEVLLFSVNLNFVNFSVEAGSIFGQLFALVVLAIAAAESAIGLALLVVYYRLNGIISMDTLGILKG